MARTYEEMVATQKKLGPTGPSGPIVDAPVANPIDMAALTAAASETAAVDSTVLNTPAQEPPNSIIRGLREDYPDLAEFPDDILVEAVRQADFEDMDEETYLKALAEAYPPTPGEAMSGLGSDIVTGLKEDIMAPGRAVGGLGAGALAGPLAEIESMPGYEELLKRGYSPNTARSLIEQRVGTMSEMSGALGEAGAAGQENVGRGAASLISGALTGGPMPGFLASQLPKLQPLIKVVQSGAVGMGSYLGAKAAADGKSANEILHATLEGAGLGGLIAPPLHGIFGQVGKTIAAIGNIPRYIAEGSAAAQAKAQQALRTQVERFAEKFQPQWLEERFGPRPWETDPAAAAPATADPNVAAATIIRRALGQDAAEVASESAVARMGERISAHRRYSMRDPSLEPSSTRPLEPPAPMAGLESPAASLASPLQRQPISPREALDAAIQAGQMKAGVAGEQMIPQAPQTAMVPEPNAMPGQMAGFEGRPQPVPPMTGPTMQGLELTPPPSAATPAPIVPMPQAPPQPVPPVPSAAPGNVPLPVTPMTPPEVVPATQPGLGLPLNIAERGGRVPVPAEPNPLKPLAPPSKAQTRPARLRFGMVQPEAGYAYHATTADRMYEIADDGFLKPHKPNYGTDQAAWPDGSKASRSYFMAGDKAKNVDQFAPETGTPVVLRIKNEGLATEKGTGDLFSNKKIPISRIEYLDEDGQWVPLKKGGK